MLSPPAAVEDQFIGQLVSRLTAKQRRLAVKLLILLLTRRDELALLQAEDGDCLHPPSARRSDLVRLPRQPRQPGSICPIDVLRVVAHRRAGSHSDVHANPWE